MGNPVPGLVAVAKKLGKNDSMNQSFDWEAWVEQLSLEDVVFSDTEWIKLGRNEDQKTRLQFIKDFLPTIITVRNLKRICVKLQVQGYKNKQKHVLCELIVNAAKVINPDAALYPEDFANKAESDDNGGEKEAKSTKKKKGKTSSTSVKSAVIQQEGTF
jgi:hypothetical protein